MSITTAPTPNPIRIAAHRRAVADNFHFLKSIDRLDQLHACSITLSDNAGYLLPLCSLHASDDALIEKLAAWRAANMDAYPTRFQVTLDGTKRWLQKGLLEVADRILFLVVDPLGTPVGHLGFNNCFNDLCEMEVDNVVRGVATAPRGMMSRAMKALLRWGREIIGADGYHLRVFADNQHAVKFYRRLGFVDDIEIPLRRTESGGTVVFKPCAEFPGDDAPPDMIFLRMRFAEPYNDPGAAMILTAGPSISQREAWYALDAARSGWNNRWSGYLTEFEREFASYVGAKHALATSSCTGALHIALVALGIGPGDEVIVPDLTWVATANAVRYAGATPVFADIELDTWNIDASSAESLITPRTKAIMPVHMYGHPARMTPLLDLAKRHGLRIVEDAAPAIGAEWQGRRCGSFGDFGAFSFQGAKLLVTGEGGMLVTNDDELYERAYRVWDQGRDPSRTFWIDRHGLKYKMANVQAAIGLGQLQRCDELVEMKRRVFSWYDEELAGVDHVRLNREVPGARSIYWMSSLFLDEASGKDRETIRAELKRRNIDTRPVFPAISQYPIWGRAIAPQPTAARVGRQAMNLPSGVCLTRAQVAYVCANIRELLSSP